MSLAGAGAEVILTGRRKEPLEAVAASIKAKGGKAHVHAADLTKVPTLGITGTGGAGKSSLTDELIRRFRLDQDDELNIAVISIDPSLLREARARRLYRRSVVAGRSGCPRFRA